MQELDSHVRELAIKCNSDDLEAKEIGMYYNLVLMQHIDLCIEGLVTRLADKNETKKVCI